MNKQITSHDLGQRPSRENAQSHDCFVIDTSFYSGIKTKVVDVTKRDQVVALANELDHVDVLFNVAGYKHFKSLHSVL